MWKTCLVCTVLIVFFGLNLGLAQEQEESNAPLAEPKAQSEEENLDDTQALYAYIDPKTGEPRPPKIPAPESAKALPKPDVVWVDTKQKLVYVDGYVSLRRGMLEMLACPVGTKEHESVVAVFSRAQTLHAALLAVGAVPGHPVSFRPKFRPAAGTEIDVEIRWQDKDGKWQSVKGQDWVKDARTQKPMEHSWVFAGSGFWQDEETGKEYYKAEAGDLICVSNFSTAMLDIPVESSQVNDGLMFEANSEKIPRLGTPVRVVLKPVLPKK
jgi:hypothetical protein